MGNAGTNGSAAGDFVCRVVVPEERLNPYQATGFQILGFDLPFLVFGALSNSLAGLLVFIFVIAAVGVAFIARGGGLKTNSHWWRNAWPLWVTAPQTDSLSPCSWSLCSHARLLVPESGTTASSGSPRIARRPVLLAFAGRAFG